MCKFVLSDLVVWKFLSSCYRFVLRVVFASILKKLSVDVDEYLSEFFEFFVIIEVKDMKIGCMDDVFDV